MRFHVTIKDNETGVVHIDNDTDAIIGAISADEARTQVFGLTNCNAIKIYATMKGAKAAIDEIKKENPQIELFERLDKLFDDFKPKPEATDGTVN